MGLPVPSSQASRRESFNLDEKGLGRKNRAFLAVKHELAEREKNKKKRLKAAKKGKLKADPKDEVRMFSVGHDGYCSVVMSGHVSVSASHVPHVPMFQAVAYVDAQRNMAVTMGERDVKSDVKEKSRQE